MTDVPRSVDPADFNAIQPHLKPFMRFAEVVVIVGAPKEIKPQENRIALVPAGARQLVDRGHTVLIERDAGAGSGMFDSEYEAAGAQIVDTAEDVWGQADMVYKVKEPVAAEYPLLRDGQIIYAYLHLAPDPDQAEALLHSGAVSVAFETIETPDRRTPLLAPMSEVAGRLSVQMGARCLESHEGGRGILLGGVPGVRPARVVVIGGGMVGKNAAWTATGLGADVTMVDVNIDTLRWYDDTFHGKIKTLYSTAHTLESAVTEADLVIGAVLLPGARAPRLVTEDHVRQMKRGAAIVDVAVDQGGCVETIHATTHANPTYLVHDVVHYGVANMPGAVPRTSTFALHNATFPYAMRIADLGWEQAIRNDPVLAKGLNTSHGVVRHQAVAEALGLPFEAWSA